MESGCGGAGLEVRRPPGHLGSPKGWAAEQRMGGRIETTPRLPGGKESLDEGGGVGAQEAGPVG